MKKLLALVCAFALICSLGFTTVGCGKKDAAKTTTTGGTPPAGGTTTTTTR